VVVTGASGAFGRILMPRLARAGHRVVGVDRSPWPECPKEIPFHKVDILKRGFDDVLRAVHADAVIHLAIIHKFAASQRERHRVNFNGTARVIEASFEHGVKTLVVGSRATVYGALADQGEFLTEKHPPGGGAMFSDMQDLVGADLYATGQLWRYPDHRLSVLRLVNVLGPHMNTLLQRFLLQRRIFTVAGFDPIYQVMHEDDMALALQLALEQDLRGVFNVAGPGTLPLHALIRESGGSKIPLPEPLVSALKGRLGFPRIPDGAVAFLKYSCTVDDALFRKITDYRPTRSLADIVDAIAALRRG
jgi:UDP-glucose 4-epimerase